MSLDGKVSLIKSAIPPAAFICTFSHKLMEEPVLSLCGHLFEKSLIKVGMSCPIDQKPLSIKNCIPFNELRNSIRIWKATAMKMLKPLLKKERDSKYFPISGADANLLSSSNAVASNTKNSPLVSSLHKKDLPINALNALSISAKTIQPWSRVIRVHNDDIHGFIRKSENSFYSGSKDGTVKLWKNNGTLIRKINVGLTRFDYRHWVTALAQMADQRLIVGFRDGWIYTYSSNGQCLRTFQNRPTMANHICKQRNKMRINCIKPISKRIFYVGVPEYVQIWDSELGWKGKFKIRRNDWVYCIESVANYHLAIVAGSELYLYQKKNRIYERVVSLVEEEKSTRPQKERPHISSLISINKEKTCLATASFDGSIQILDINRQANQSIIRKWTEHKKRAWCVIKMEENIIASGADDRIVKIWDIRCPKNIQNLGPHCGRASSLIKVGHKKLAVGSCATNVWKSTEKAVMTFWDLKK